MRPLGEGMGWVRRCQWESRQEWRAERAESCAGEKEVGGRARIDRIVFTRCVGWEERVKGEERTWGREMLVPWWGVGRAGGRGGILWCGQ